MSPRSIAVWLCGAWFGLAGALALAADGYKPGDTVEVQIFSDWAPATVVAVEKSGNVLADYEHGGKPGRKAFKPQHIRFAYEAGAIARGRTWSDASGKFRIKAALLAIHDDETITLRKTDQTELKIAVAKLSSADQQFLKQLQAQGGVAVMKGPDLLAVETFEENPFGSAAAGFGGEAEQRVAIVPDPIPAYLKLKQGGAVFPLDQRDDTASAVLPLGGPEGWVLAAVESGHRFEEETPVRLTWISLTFQKVENRQLLPAGEVVLDYHPPTRRLLTRSVEASSNPFPDHKLPPEILEKMARRGINKHLAKIGLGQTILTLWEVAPRDKRAKPLVRWRGGDAEKSRQAWARLIDGNIVLERRQEEEYIAWDTTAKQAKYKLTQEAFSARPAVLSGGRKYLFMPEDKGIRVIDAATGGTLNWLPLASRPVALGASDDGRRLAVLAENDLLVWDLTAPEAAPNRLEGQALRLQAQSLAWIGDDWLVADRGNSSLVLYSLKSKLPVWNYQFDSNAIQGDAGQRLRQIVDGHLVYASRVKVGRDEHVAVGAAALPGPGVEEAAAGLTYDSLLIVKPGTPIRLQVSTGADDARVRAALEAKIKANGWVLNDSAELVMTASMGRSETQSVTYTSGGFGRRETTQTVTVTPHYSSLQIKAGNRMIWTSGTSTGVPNRLRLKDGETAQSEVDKLQNPNPTFFERVEIPAKIIDPEKTAGAGTTEVTNRGLVVK
ncbi:MAG: SHD1 domain-containing protein [Pirellulaceae bacterium]